MEKKKTYTPPPHGDGGNGNGHKHLVGLGNRHRRLQQRGNIGRNICRGVPFQQEPLGFIKNQTRRSVEQGTGGKAQ